jgi:hypothetical protein
MYLELLLHLYVFKWQHVFATHVLLQLANVDKLKACPILVLNGCKVSALLPPYRVNFVLTKEVLMM